MRLRSLTIVLLSLLAMAIAPLGLAAEQSLSANDLNPTQLSATTVFDGFTILATAAKGVTIEALPDGRTASDGEVFTARIKMNGGGTLESRAI